MIAYTKATTVTKMVTTTASLEELEFSKKFENLIFEDFSVYFRSYKSRFGGNKWLKIKLTLSKFQL